jgi:hypothetical protein
VTKICLLALTLMIAVPTVSRQLSEGPGPMPICPPDNPQGCVIGNNPLLLP